MLYFHGVLLMFENGAINLVSGRLLEPRGAALSCAGCFHSTHGIVDSDYLIHLVTCSRPLVAGSASGRIISSAKLNCLTLVEVVLEGI